MPFFRDETRDGLIDDLYKIIREENVTDEIGEQLRYRFGEIEFASDTDELNFVKEEVNNWLNSIKPDLTILAEKREEALNYWNAAINTYIISKADFLKLINKSFEKDLLSTESIKLQDDFDLIIERVKNSEIDYKAKEVLLSNLECLESICEILFANEVNFDNTDNFYSKELKQELKNIIDDYKSSGLSDEKYYEVNESSNQFIGKLANEFLKFEDNAESKDFWSRCCNKLYSELEEEVNQIVERNDGYYSFEDFIPN